MNVSNGYKFQENESVILYTFRLTLISFDLIDYTMYTRHITNKKELKIEEGIKRKKI